jgi:arsenate reductase-like glutaredoxin family protein
MKFMQFCYLIVLLCFISITVSADELSQQDLEGLLEISGVTSDINSFPDLFTNAIKELKTQNNNISDEQFSKLLLLTEQSFPPPVFIESINKQLQMGLNKDDLNSLMAWYRSPLGREITSAEEAASSDEAYEAMAKNAQNLLANKRLVERAKQIDLAMNASQLLFTITKNSGVAMYAATNKINEPTANINVTDFTAVIEAQKQEMLDSIQNQIVLMISYSLQSIEDDKIQQYVAFLNSASAKKFVNATLTGLDKAFESSIYQFVDDLGAMFQEQLWPLAEFLSIVPPQDQDLTLQAFPELEIDHDILAAWEGEQLQFIYDVTLQNSQLNSENYWRSFIKKLKASSDDKKVDLIHEGVFVTDAGDNVEFKILMWSEKGEPYAQIVNLIKNEKYSYSVAAIPMDLNALQAISIRNVKVMKAVKLAN